MVGSFGQFRRRAQVDRWLLSYRVTWLRAFRAAPPVDEAYPKPVTVITEDMLRQFAMCSELLGAPWVFTFDHDSPLVEIRLCAKGVTNPFLGVEFIGIEGDRLHVCFDKLSIRGP